ncbi:HAMP domain-containing histidine kinase [Chryseobacterium sp. SSA4.19]|uniref:sensor histidine kinase n=1 Tax=Chryseobacterium sp. SSA4.19 TaxID=2919915 RepID=UPI001F4DA5E7|nr:HAMP domain-containing sensor histidine kinase [Chryseobacterium sp. SSA4.19]MCJ8155114.1 HAMP domain-containing histidine kinase [Chryseobacterium sp. SSA4.19]
MNRKKISKVGLFLFSLAILVVLQVYFIYNSYRLEEKELNRQARDMAELVIAKMEKYDASTNEDKLVADFQKLNNKINIQREEIIHHGKITASGNEQSRKLEMILKEQLCESGFDLAIKSEIYSVYDELTKKELLPENRSVILYQTAKPITKPLVINEGKWSSRNSSKNTEINLEEKQNYLIKSKSSFQLLNIRFLILKKIIPLVVISLFIVCLIIYLFRNSMRNLNRQENKILQLHTTIDSIAHELNTPITTLKFSIVQSPDIENKALLERQVKRLENIVSSIHSYDSEGARIDKKEIENYFSELRITHQHTNFNIKIDFIENKLLLYNDFKQIMDNLMNNALKYGATEIEVFLKVDKAVEIKISDNGIGIPKEEHKLIFEKYYRVTRPENFHVNGLGVGLFLVKTIVDKYKGDIGVQSKKKGVTFKIMLRNEA